MSWLSSLFKGKKAKTVETTDSTTNANTTVAPYAPTIPYIDDYLANLNEMFNNAEQVSPLEQQGYDQLKGIAASGPTALTTAGTNELQKTISGDYLTPDTNPYLADIAKRVGSGVMQNINTTFGGHGRTGSGLHMEQAAEGVGNALTDFYGQQYGNERSRQVAALGQVPAYDAARYNGPQAIISAGQNLSARPFDIAQTYGGILGNIAALGHQGTANTTANTNAVTTGPRTGGFINSFTNKLFPGVGNIT